MFTSHVKITTVCLFLITPCILCITYNPDNISNTITSRTGTFTFALHYVIRIRMIMNIRFSSPGFGFVRQVHSFPIMRRCCLFCLILPCWWHIKMMFVPKFAVPKRKQLDRVKVNLAHKPRSRED